MNFGKIQTRYIHRFLAMCLTTGLLSLLFHGDREAFFIVTSVLSFAYIVVVFFDWVIEFSDKD